MIYQNNKMLATSFTSAGTSIDIEEYDTDDGWHVRKWSDGYIEMIGSFECTFVPSDWSINGNIHSLSTSKIPIHQYPVELNRIYSETLEMSSYDMAITVSQYSREHDNETKRYALFRSTTMEGDYTATFTFTYFVTGRWKKELTVTLPEFISAKASSAKIIDEI